MPIREWKVVRGKTNGVRHTTYNLVYRDAVCPTIHEADDMDCVTLVINGYQFKCKSVEDAKREAEVRLKNNVGIYLPWSWYK